MRAGSPQAVLVALAVGVVLAAPLATLERGGRPGAVTISGARSLSDQVVVTFGAEADKQRTTDVHLLAFNDLHGNLEAAGNNIYGQFAGGAAYLAKAVKDRQAHYGELQATRPRGRQHRGQPAGQRAVLRGAHHHRQQPDERRLRVGRQPRVRQGQGRAAAHPERRLPPGRRLHRPPRTRSPNGATTNVYPGADFQYLSANVVVDATGETLFPAYGTKRFKSDSGKKFEVGFIGEVLEATPTIVTPTGVAGLTFQDEADAANRAVAELKSRGVNTSVLVIHEGGFQTHRSAQRLRRQPGRQRHRRHRQPARPVDQGHRVGAHPRRVPLHDHAGGVTRLITSASSFGRILSDITLTIDDKTGKLVQASAENVDRRQRPQHTRPGRDPRARPAKEDPQVKAVVDQYVTASAPLANRVIGRIQGDLTRTGLAARRVGAGRRDRGRPVGGHPAGRPRAARSLAFMNPGGIRADLRVADISSGGEAPGEVTYGEAFTVQPFGNSLVTKTMTGDMIRRLLQQQFPGCGLADDARASCRSRRRSATSRPRPPPRARARSGGCSSTGSRWRPPTRSG